MPGRPSGKETFENSCRRKFLTPDIPERIKRDPSERQVEVGCAYFDSILALCDEGLHFVNDQLHACGDLVERVSSSI